jgi:ubiquitin-like domain-containing CTD phosphatase 1
MSVLSQPPSDVIPVVVDAMVLSTEVRMTFTQRVRRCTPDQNLRLQVTLGEKPEVGEKWIHLAFSWSGKNFTLDIAESDRSVSLVHSLNIISGVLEEVLILGLFAHRVFDLKVALRELTAVPEERQKILGLVKGKLPPEQERMYVPRLHIP